MKFGVSYNTGYYGPDPGALLAVARHAEDCGFESFCPPSPSGSSAKVRRPAAG